MSTMKPIPLSPVMIHPKPPVHDPQTVIDALSDAVIVVDLECRIQQANRAACLWAGLDPESIQGRNCHDVFRCVPLAGTSECECPLPAVRATGEPVKVTHIHHLPGSGKLRYVDIIASPLKDDNGRIIAVIEAMRDVTAERELAETLVRRNEHLSVLNSIARTVNQSLDLAEILNRALEEVLRLASVDVGAIFLRDEIVGSLELLAHRGLSEAAARIIAQFGMMDGSCGGVIEHQRLIVVPEVQRYRSRRTEAIREERVSTLVHVPLIAHGSSLGSMCVGTRQPREFDSHEQELLTAIGNQIAVAVENARLYAELQHKEHIRGELLRKVISAQEEERKRIARELHDEVSQNLTALIYAAEEATDLHQPPETQRLLDNIRKIAQQTLDGVHKLIFDLRPTMLDHLGLVPALRWFAQTRLEAADMRVVIKEECRRALSDGEPCRLPPETETAVFRVVQEAINNVARHSLARNVHLTFSLGDDEMTMLIEDDGIGFDLMEVSVASESGRGLGLIGMQERIQLVGGQMDIDTAPGYGTRIRIQVPIRDRSGQPERPTPSPVRSPVHV
ncbi:MAG: PAS domain-containing protein [Anaerolineae bacterium]|nr:PAS domain-containing protein [Anaerolineae bacterium]